MSRSDHLVRPKKVDESETERRERKRKRKEEKRALKASHSQPLTIIHEVEKISDSIKDSHVEHEEEKGHVEKLSKEERKRQKKLKKLLKRKAEQIANLENVREEIAVPIEAEPLRREKIPIQADESANLSKSPIEPDATDGKKKEKKKKKEKEKRKDKIKEEATSEVVETAPPPPVTLPTPEQSRQDEDTDVLIKLSKEERRKAKELKRKRREEKKKVKGEAESLPNTKKKSVLEISPLKESEAIPTSSLIERNAMMPQASTSNIKAVEQSPSLAEHKSPADALQASIATTTEVPPRPVRKRNISAMIDAALQKKVVGSSIRKGKAKDYDELDELAEGMGSSLTTKEEVLADAESLTLKQILVDKLYRSFQLKWLQEARGLKVKYGAFSSWEQDQMMQAIENFTKEHGMTQEELAGWINAGRTDRDNKAMYVEFWKQITACLEDRSNRTVRVFVRRMMLPKATGAWSKGELEKLSAAVGESGQRWADVAKAVGTRTAEDCRLRWRDYSDEGNKIRRLGGFTKEEEQTLKEMVIKICQEESIDYESPSAVIPWKVVASRLGGVRRANTYQSKWQSIQAAGLKDPASEDQNASEKGPQAAWTDKDTKMLLDRLSEQSRALERDDFTEVDLASLRSQEWMVETAAMRRHWRLLVRQYAGSEDYKRNFSVNLAKIKEVYAQGSVFSKQRRRRSSDGLERGSSKRKKHSKTNDEEDMIESEEEV